MAGARMLHFDSVAQAVPLVVLALLAVGPRAEAEPPYDLGTYLRVAATYASAGRASAIEEIRRWPPSTIRAALTDLKGRRGQLCAVSRSPDEIAIRTVEAAVLLHAEAGLLALGAEKRAEAQDHLDASADLFLWSRVATSEVEGTSELDVQPRIPRGLLSLALAAGALAAGSPATAHDFAQEARRLAPLDPVVQLVFGCVAQGLAEDGRLQGRESVANRWREQAARAFSEAILLDAGLFRDSRASARPISRGLEARLRLGRVALEQGWLPLAGRCFGEVDRGSDDNRQRYLARLLLGRLKDREGRPDEAAACYRRALEAWPEGQAAAFALAHALDRSSGSAAVRPLVVRALALPLRPEVLPDPWRSFLFGPPGLAADILDELRATVLGP